MINDKQLIARTTIRKNEYNEYVVRAYDANNKRMSSCDYFTNDIDDARDTSRHMTRAYDEQNKK